MQSMRAVGPFGRASCLPVCLNFCVEIWVPSPIWFSRSCFPYVDSPLQFWLGWITHRDLNGPVRMGHWPSETLWQMEVCLCYVLCTLLSGVKENLLLSIGVFCLLLMMFLWTLHHPLRGGLKNWGVSRLAPFSSRPLLFWGHGRMKVYVASGLGFQFGSSSGSGPRCFEHQHSIFFPSFYRFDAMCVLWGDLS